MFQTMNHIMIVLGYHSNQFLYLGLYKAGYAYYIY
jgi:hypothetical protein